MKNELSLINIFFYSLIAIPLSFISLPLYVNVPKFYFDLGLSLSSLSTAIILIRILDAFCDPLFGIFFKKYHTKRLLICFIFSPIIGISFYFLFNPSLNHLFLNMVLALVITNLAGSAISINYESYAAEISNSYHNRTKIISIREAFQVIGIIFATVIPSFIGYQYFSLLSLIIIVIFSALAFFKGKEADNVENPVENKKNILELLKCFKEKKFKFLIITNIFNSIASSIPAVMFLFFVSQVLKARQIEGAYFLLTYFLSAFISMPFWYFLSKKFEKKKTWQFSILLALLTFVWSFFLNETNFQLFYVVCIFSGFALGGDLTMPTAILSDIAHKNIAKTSQYYGIWGFLSKFNFALATLISFSLLNFLNQHKIFTNNVSFIYAIIPFALKFLALIYLTFKFSEDL